MDGQTHRQRDVLASPSTLLYLVLRNDESAGVHFITTLEGLSTSAIVVNAEKWAHRVGTDSDTGMSSRHEIFIGFRTLCLFFAQCLPLVNRG
jgi:hypothetical protein